MSTCQLVCMRSVEMLPVVSTTTTWSAHKQPVQTVSLNMFKTTVQTLLTTGVWSVCDRVVNTLFSAIFSVICKFLIKQINWSEFSLVMFWPVFFQFETSINVSVSNFRCIWITILWLSGHYTYFNYFSAMAQTIDKMLSWNDCFYCTGRGCDDDPCHNGATCVPVGDAFDCVCVIGFAGVRCEAGTIYTDQITNKLVDIMTNNDCQCL